MVDHLPENHFEKRFDGQTWRIFDLERGNVVVTACGQELLHKTPELLGLFHDYRDEAVHPRRQSLARRWFKAGGNSDVYEAGNQGVVVKEVSTSQSVWSALDRMDYLHSVCATYLPEQMGITYLRVPAHLAAVFSGDLRKQYLVMERANLGVTVEDVISNPSIDRNTRDLVNTVFKSSRPVLDKAIKRALRGKRSPKDLLPDWHEGNVIVDFAQAAGNVPFTFWIVDQ